MPSRKQSPTCSREPTRLPSDDEFVERSDRSRVVSLRGNNERRDVQVIRCLNKTGWRNDFPQLQSPSVAQCLGGSGPPSLKMIQYLLRRDRLNVHYTSDVRMSRQFTPENFVAAAVQSPVAVSPEKCKMNGAHSLHRLLNFIGASPMLKTLEALVEVTGPVCNRRPV